jgi:hypothetical protein
MIDISVINKYNWKGRLFEQRSIEIIYHSFKLTSVVLGDERLPY